MSETMIDVTRYTYRVTWSVAVFEGEPLKGREVNGPITSGGETAQGGAEGPLECAGGRAAVAGA